MWAVIFDMDGTIFDSERVVYELWRELAPRFGFTDMERVHPLCVGVSGVRRQQVFREYCGEAFPLEQFDEAVRREFRKRFGEGRLPLKTGAREILEELHRRGIPLALASSSHIQTIRRELAEAGLLACFDFVIGGDCIRQSKPAPDIFLAAARGLGVEPACCYVIEDSYNGIRGAHAAGMRPIMVPDLKPADAEMEELAEAVLPELPAVLAYLRKKEAW